MLSTIIDIRRMRALREKGKADDAVAKGLKRLAKVRKKDVDEESYRWWTVFRATVKASARAKNENGECDRLLWELREAPGADEVEQGICKESVILLAYTLQTREEWEKAEQVLLEFWPYVRDDPEAIYRLGLCYIRRGADEAVEWIRRAAAGDRKVREKVKRNASIAHLIE